MGKPALTSMALDACKVMGQQIREARIDRRWTLAEVASVVRVSIATVSKIEHGDPSVAFGTVLQTAIAVGVDPFGADREELAHLRRTGSRRLALMPQRVRAPGREHINDDF